MSTNELQRRINNLIRIGIVTAVDVTARTCNIDLGDNQIIERPFATIRAGQTKRWSPPTVGEQTIVLSPCGDLSQSLILPAALFYDSNPAPSESEHIEGLYLPDGGQVTYNHEDHALDISLPEGATININAPTKITISSTNTEITTKLKVIGDSEFVGKLSASQAVTFADTLNVAKKTTLSDDVNIGKALTATGEVTGNGIALSDHIHPTTDEGAPTGPPQ